MDKEFILKEIHIKILECLAQTTKPLVFGELLAMLYGEDSPKRRSLYYYLAELKKNGYISSHKTDRMYGRASDSYFYLLKKGSEAINKPHRRTRPRDLIPDNHTRTLVCREFNDICSSQGWTVFEVDEYKDTETQEIRQPKREIIAAYFQAALNSVAINIIPLRIPDLVIFTGKEPAIIVIANVQARRYALYKRLLFWYRQILPYVKVIVIALTEHQYDEFNYVLENPDPKYKLRSDIKYAKLIHVLLASDLYELENLL